MVDSGRPVRGPRMKHGSSLLSLIFSADGKRILGAGGGRIPGCDSSIRVWDTATGKELLTCHAHICGLYDLAIDPRTGILASASEDYSVILWNLEQRDVIFLVGGPRIVKGSVAFASDRGLIAIGETEAFDNRLSSALVIDLDRGEEVFRQKLKRGESISALAISPTGNRLITAVRDFYDGNDTDVSCWTLKDGKREWSTSFRAACFKNSASFRIGNAW